MSDSVATFFMVNHAVIVAVIGIICLVLVIAAFFADRSLDRKRIEKYLRAQGATLESLIRDPFGMGWVFTRGQYFYRVMYRDRDGLLHTAFCKTRLLAGVCLIEDTIVPKSSDSRDGLFQMEHSERAMPSSSASQRGNSENLVLENRRLWEENLRLREELTRLKENDRGGGE